jgi:hypothetical protein
MNSPLKVEGILALHYETGMEGCWGATLQDLSTNTPNENYDPNDPSKGPKEYYNHSGMYGFKTGDQLVIKDKMGTVIFNDTITKDRKAMAEQKYCLDFIPKEIDFGTWVTYLKSEFTATLIRVKK